MGAEAMAPMAAPILPLLPVTHVRGTRIPTVPCLGSRQVSLGSAAPIHGFYPFLSLWRVVSHCPDLTYRWWKWIPGQVSPVACKTAAATEMWARGSIPCFPLGFRHLALHCKHINSYYWKTGFLPGPKPSRSLKKYWGLFLQKDGARERVVLAIS